MSEIAIGHQEAHEKLTARLFYRPQGEVGYIDAGNVREFVDATSRTFVTRAVAEDGFRRINDEQVDVDHMAYTFLCDEHDEENEKLIRLAKETVTTAQSRVEGTTASLSTVKLGRWYPIGAYGVANVEVTSSVDGICEEGTDYEVDTDNGRVKPLKDAGISEGADLTVTFDKPSISMQQWTAQERALLYGDFIIEEHSQHSQMWLRRTTFSGNLNVVEFPSQTGEFGTFRLKATPNTKPVTLKRPTAVTTAAAPETTEAAGMSSSSSSSSSATTSASNSSSSS